MIQLDQVTKRFKQETLALENLTLTVEKGEWVFLTGPSGAGKTTLMNLIFGTLRPSSGHIEVFGLDLNTASSSECQTHRRNIGFVFQNARLLPHLSVFENVAMPLHIRGFSDHMIEKMVFKSLDQLGMTDRVASHANVLSGGEKQKVALARAIVAQPGLVLADEPTGNLDSESGLHIMELFNHIHRQGTTILLATHDENWVNQYSGRVLRLKSGKMEVNEHV
jgi:cell division transport system ATP-binding protein